MDHGLNFVLTLHTQIIRFTVSPLLAAVDSAGLYPAHPNAVSTAVEVNHDRFHFSLVQPTALEMDHAFPGKSISYCCIVVVE